MGQKLGVVLFFFLQRRQHPPELGFDILPEAGETAILAVPVDQRSAEFIFKPADGARQARL